MRTVSPLTCTGAEELLQSYVDGLLDAGTVTVVDAHLAACPQCASAYAFEVKFRSYVRACCSGDAPCREELRRKLERCREQASLDG